jgi:hypothetical protein
MKTCSYPGCRHAPLISGGTLCWLHAPEVPYREVTP